MKNREEKRLFVTYEIALLLKGAQAFLEILAGLLVSIVSTNAIARFIVIMAHSELAESPNNAISNFLIHSAQQLSVSGKFSIIFFLLSHGIIKLAIIIGLFLKKSWAYPASLIGLGGLIAYQIYSLLRHYSILLLVLTIIDIIIIWLIIREHDVHL